MSENYYILFGLGVSAVVIIIAGLIHRSYILSNQMELANRAQRRKSKEQAAQQKAENKNLKRSQKANRPSPIATRQLQNVRVPWGWPHHVASEREQIASTNHSHSFRQFAGKLMNPKRTKEDQEYLEKRNASIRALLEDRYGRASRMTEVEYRNVKAPLLRDPNQQYDQLDSMPSSRANAVLTRLKNQKRSDSNRLMPGSRSTDLHDVKTPWGW